MTVAEPLPGEHHAPDRAHLDSGLLFSLVAAASFSTSGTLASGLLTAGWTPSLAVTLRIAIAALVLLPMTIRAVHGQWHLLRSNAQTIIAYGVLAVALPQTCYFFAVQRLPVGPAILIEYVAPLVVLVWQWAVHGQRPTKLTITGSAVAVAGLLLVIGISADTALDPIGVLWATGGMFGAAAYFILSAKPDTGLPPMALAGGGLGAGGLLLFVLGLVGVLPFKTGDAVAHYGAWTVPSWVGLLALGLVSAALAYSAGIAATRRLGSRLASFVGLIEVVFAFTWAWLLLGQTPTLVQAGGAVLLLIGVAVVKTGEPD